MTPLKLKDNTDQLNDVPKLLTLLSKFAINLLTKTLLYSTVNVYFVSSKYSNVEIKVQTTFYSFFLVIG